jgi:hypothetical protein
MPALGSGLVSVATAAFPEGFFPSGGGLLLRSRLGLRGKYRGFRQRLVQDVQLLQEQLVDLLFVQRQELFRRFGVQQVLIDQPLDSVFRIVDLGQQGVHLGLGQELVVQHNPLEDLMGCLGHELLPWPLVARLGRSRYVETPTSTPMSVIAWPAANGKTQTYRILRATCGSGPNCLPFSHCALFLSVCFHPCAFRFKS